jgi:hypothetical protein
MRMRWLIAILLPAAVWPQTAAAAKQKPCVTTAEAAQFLNRDVCIAAHVYEVVQLPDGTRFLDVCAPETPDADCRFTIVSLWADRGDVGELSSYRDANVRVRGIVRPMHGRAGLVLSHVRQFSGGPPKFRPNPKLARGFSADSERMPVADPNLRSQGGARSFMNSRDLDTRKAK